MATDSSEDVVQSLLRELDQLIVQARDHEEALVSLVESLEAGMRENAPAAAAAFGSPAALLHAVRTLCVNAREHRLRIQTVQAQLTAQSQNQQQRRSRSVLIVDDAPDTREVVSVALEIAGLHVLTATNGLEGVILAHTMRPSIILMDINMPIMDGIEAARLLKAADATRHINVIAHTAKPDFSEGPLISLFAGVLRKPALPEHVLACVMKFTQTNDHAG